MKLSSRLTRSAIDATRFTATSPHAYSNPTPLRSTSLASTTISPSIPNASTSRLNPRPPLHFSNPNPARQQPIPGGPGSGSGENVETAAEKVARLRAARMAEREAQVTRWDRIVIWGRTWADTGHRVTVYSLVAFSVISLTITAYAVTDMILHNRRKRSAFFAEQRSLYGIRLLGAIEAEKAGFPLDEDQVLVLGRERAKIQAEEERKNRSWAKAVRDFFMGGLKVEDEGRVVVPSEGEILERIGVRREEVMVGLGAGGNPEAKGEEEAEKVGGEGGIVKAVEETRREGERVMESRGVSEGPLDQMADAVVERAKSKSSSWLSWGR